MSALANSSPNLQAFLIETQGCNPSIDFAEPQAVKALNAALLAHYYGIRFWDIPAGYLCPPVPGRADYIHNIADLLAQQFGGQVPLGKKIVGLDIGVGANAIYPIIGSQVYGWKFVGSDIDPVSVKSATMIAKANPKLHALLKVRKQDQIDRIFDGIIQPTDNFNFCLCNPPFHSSPAQAALGSQRKVANLARHRQKRNLPRSSMGNKNQTRLNFAGTPNELWCEGGELGFIRKMIEQSVNYAHQVGWFTCLVSNKDNLVDISQYFAHHGISHTQTIHMAQGQKRSRFIAWRFN